MILIIILIIAVISSIIILIVNHLDLEPLFPDQRVWVGEESAPAPALAVSATVSSPLVADKPVTDEEIRSLTRSYLTSAPLI